MILTAIDGLTRAGVDSAARRAMLDTFVELEELRAVVMALFNVLPPCVHCGMHLATYLEKKSDLLDAQGTYRCRSCFEDLSDNDREEYTALPWSDLTDRLEALYGAWTKNGIPTPDPESIAQKSFSFR